MWSKAQWIRIPHGEYVKKGIYPDEISGRFAYFRCEVALPKGCTLTVDVTANLRYRLWINGRAVLSGPCKGDVRRQYYDTVDLSGHLCEGKNVFAAQVYYAEPDAVETMTDAHAAICGVVGRHCGHRFALEGEVLDQTGSVVTSISTGEADWRVWLEESFILRSDHNTQFLGAVMEDFDAALRPMGWKARDFDASRWAEAEAVWKVSDNGPFYLVGMQPMFRLHEREIPLLYEREAPFVRSAERDGTEIRFLRDGALTVKPRERREIILDAGSLVNAYPRFCFDGGKGSSVSICYFEKFTGEVVGERRDDYRGEIAGITDHIRLDGEPLCFEPFWVRSFRFVQIVIKAGVEPVTVHAPDYRKTGYPLQTESFVRSKSAPWVGKLWDMSLRTLENCMLETYMDCPYYEQMQYGMDTRLEALFTYAVSRDSKLSRKALLDFHRDMQPEGLITGKSPSAYPQILSTFSLHYIFLLREYVQHTGDAAILRLCRRDVDSILDTYDEHIGPDGLVGRLGFWEFVDWQEAWVKTGGMPEAILHGPSTIINLMYAYALGCGAELMERSGRPLVAQEYRERRERLLKTVQALCWDREARLYREGPDFRQVTSHAQAWAVLNELSDEPAALLRRAMTRQDVLKCTFSTSYEWFRALETAGLFQELRAELDDWIGLIDLGCTTCPETPKNARSDCHAWSALPLYELTHTIAGVREREDGTILVSPHLAELGDLEGRVVTRRGAVDFCYRKQDGVWHCELTLPDGADGLFQAPSGETKPLHAGENQVKFSIF